MRAAAAVGAILFVVAVTLAGWQEASTQPATRAAPTSQSRLNALIGLIEDPKNPPEARRTGARELLAQSMSETPPRLVAILGGQNGPAKVAIAAVLAESPQYLDAMYVDPLIGMLGDADADVRAAAAGALAGYRDGGVIPRLRGQSLDSEQPQRARLGAIAALGLMVQRRAIDGLADALEDPDPVIADAALAALERATAMDFGDDHAAARSWCEESRALSDQDWQQLQMERLVRKELETRNRLEAVEARLVSVLEANFQRASDAERVTLLSSYLTDNTSTIRLVGLKLIQTQLAEGRELPAELIARIRDLMAGSEPREQAAAVRAVASLRKPEDADAFLTMLPGVRNRAVRLALINGVGYVGNATAVDTLLAELEGADEESATEVVAALGRLAERGVLQDERRAAVVQALLQVFETTKPAQVALRERTLWAMGNVADARFGPAFATALGSAEAVAVRQAAARGIGLLNDPKLADALAAAANDPDTGVRKTAIETLAVRGFSDKHLQALWGRLTSPPETDEAIRQAAWRGALTILAKRPPAQIEEWIARLPGEGAQRTQRTLEALERVAKAVQESEPVDHARLGSLRARIAAQHAQLEQPAEAVAEYLKALPDLRGTESAPRVAVELLRCALRGGLYDQTVARALTDCDPRPDGTVLWQAVRAEVEPRLTPEGVAEAVAMLAAVESNPPGKWSNEAQQAIAQLRQRAQRLTQLPAESQPTPTSVRAAGAKGSRRSTQNNAGEAVPASPCRVGLRYEGLRDSRCSDRNLPGERGSRCSDPSPGPVPPADAARA